MKIYFIDRYDFNDNEFIKKFSGYEQIINYSNNFKRIKGNNFINKILVLLIPKFPRNYIKYNISKEFFAFFYGLILGRPIFYLYADKDAFMLPILKRKFGLKRLKIFGTLHWPKELSREYSFYKFNLENQFKGLITLSNSLGENLKSSKRIHHGINLKYWKNENPYFHENYFLIVGHSNRNHEKQLEIVKYIIEKDITAKFKIINKNLELTNLYKLNDNVEIYNELISDSELLNFYSSAKAVILFQNYCLASNVVMESIAMRIPLITNDVGDISEYLGKKYCLYINSSNDLAKIDQFLENDILRNNIVDDFNILKDQYDWKIISKETIQFIKENI